MEQQQQLEFFQQDKDGELHLIRRAGERCPVHDNIIYDDGYEDNMPICGPQLGADPNVSINAQNEIMARAAAEEEEVECVLMPGTIEISSGGVL
jgi:hypothetical protein